MGVLYVFNGACGGGGGAFLAVSAPPTSAHPPSTPPHPTVACGLLGLKLVNVPMFFCIRRLVPLFILVTEWLFQGRVASPGVRVAVCIIAGATVLAGWDSLVDDFGGFAITGLNNFFTAGAFIMQKQFNETTRLSTFTVVYYNALVALPLTLLMAIVMGEPAKFAGFVGAPTAFWVTFAVASCMGLVLTYTSVLSNVYNSPLATSITGNGKDIVTTAVGWSLFGGFKATPRSVSGLLLSFLGAAMYSYVNLVGWRATQSAAAQAEAGAKRAGGEGESETASLLVRPSVGEGEQGGQEASASPQVSRRGIGGLVRKEVDSPARRVEGKGT